jgi:hypothetical protein
MKRKKTKFSDCLKSFVLFALVILLFSTPGSRAQICSAGQYVSGGSCVDCPNGKIKIFTLSLLFRPFSYLYSLQAMALVVDIYK